MVKPHKRFQSQGHMEQNLTEHAYCLLSCRDNLTLNFLILPSHCDLASFDMSIYIMPSHNILSVSLSLCVSVCWQTLKAFIRLAPLVFPIAVERQSIYWRHVFIMRIQYVFRLIAEERERETERNRQRDRDRDTERQRQRDKETEKEISNTHEMLIWALGHTQAHTHTCVHAHTQTHTTHTQTYTHTHKHTNITLPKQKKKLYSFIEINWSRQ